MGIPSYYRKLTTRVKGLVSKSLPQKPSSLFFDFNCLIYHVARKPQTNLPPYPGHHQKEEWEGILLDEIVRYIMKVWHEVGQPREVFLSVDGVVPMAKIKQQRMRRFKSVWLAEQEKQHGLRENKETWDTNCITPGTRFMRKLNARLSELNKKPGWRISGSDEPGEGEHKIMKMLRERQESKEPIVIYGLDADLILLTMLNSKSPAFLVREDTDNDTPKDDEYMYFSVDVLKSTLPCPVVDYVAAMSLLGNDFLPHSMSIRIKDDGHQVLLQALQNMIAEGKRFVYHDIHGCWKMNNDVLEDFLKIWAAQEEERMLLAIKKKVQQASSFGKNGNTLNHLPLQWCIDREFLSKHESWTLDSSWRSLYRKEWNACSSPASMRKLCAEYLFGLQWVLDYYTGQTPVEMTWCFPQLSPPLWVDLHSFLQQGYTPQAHFPASQSIQPEEQLAMVLPLESWHLLEEPKLRSLPSKLPQFWPLSFGFHSLGKFQLWECEPLIPILTIDRIREILA